MSLRSRRSHFLPDATDGLPAAISATIHCRVIALRGCILTNGPAMRAAQERISARMLKEFGLTPKMLREEIAAGLATSLEAGQARALESARTLVWAQRASARVRRGKPLGPRHKAVAS